MPFSSNQPIVLPCRALISFAPKKIVSKVLPPPSQDLKNKVLFFMGFYLHVLNMVYIISTSFSQSLI